MLLDLEDQQTWTAKKLGAANRLGEKQQQSPTQKPVLVTAGGGGGGGDGGGWGGAKPGATTGGGEPVAGKKGGRKGSQKEAAKAAAKARKRWRTSYAKVNALRAFEALGEYGMVGELSEAAELFVSRVAALHQVPQFLWAHDPGFHTPEPRLVRFMKQKEVERILEKLR